MGEQWGEMGLKMGLLLKPELRALLCVCHDAIVQFPLLWSIRPALCDRGDFGYRVGTLASDAQTAGTALQ